MRLKNADYIFLKNVYAALESCGRKELLPQLGDLLMRFERKREEVRTKNRERAAKYRV